MNKWFNLFFHYHRYARIYEMIIKNKKILLFPEYHLTDFPPQVKLTQGEAYNALLMYAKYYAYMIQDKELCIRTLHEVIDAPDDLFPEMGFVNAAAKVKAKQLLEDVDNIY